VGQRSGNWLTQDDQYESETGDVVSSASQMLSPLSQEERNLLKKLSDFAAKSSRRPDSKTQKLLATNSNPWLRLALAAFTPKSVS